MIHHYEITIACDGCRSELCDGDWVYCSGCHKTKGEETPEVRDRALQLVRQWIDDNYLLLSSDDRQLFEIMFESMKGGRPPLRTGSDSR